MSQRATRPFSTTSGVHPAYLPSLHKASRWEKKLVPAAVATVGIGYGISVYKQSQIDQQHDKFSQSSRSTRRPSEEAMMNAYGDRSSLSELESAVAEYEAQRKER